MPYAKNAKKYKGSRLYPKKKVDNSRFAKRVSKITNKIINKQVEYKFAEKVLNTECSTTANTTNIVEIARGTDISERVGREIAIRSLELRGIIKPKSTATTQQTCRVQIVIDKEPKGAIAAPQDINSTTGVMGMYNLDNRRRFITIFDDIVDLAPYDQGTSRTILFKKQLFLPIVFGGTNFGDIRDIQENTILINCVGTATTGTDQTNTFTGLVRLRYTDE